MSFEVYQRYNALLLESLIAANNPIPSAQTADVRRFNRFINQVRIISNHCIYILDLHLSFPSEKNATFGIF